MSLIEYVDFTLDGVDIRTTYGIYRTSDSASGYDRDGMPKFESKTKENETGDGTYWFGDHYRGLDIKIPIAFDNLYREDWEKFMKFLERNKYFALIFSEQPYKKYYVRVSAPPEVSFIPHDSDYDQPITSKTIFKGKGSLSFTCDDGYAICPNKNPSAYSSLPNYNDFIGESGLIDLAGYNTIIDNTSSVDGQYYINLYNGGKLPSDYRLNLNFATEPFETNDFDPAIPRGSAIEIDIYQKVSNNNVLLTHYDLNGDDIGHRIPNPEISNQWYHFGGEIVIDSKTHCIGNHDFSTLYPSFNTTVPNIKQLPVGYGLITLNGYYSYNYIGHPIQTLYFTWTAISGTEAIQYDYKYF